MTVLPTIRENHGDLRDLRGRSVVRFKGSKSAKTSVILILDYTIRYSQKCLSLPLAISYFEQTHSGGEKRERKGEGRGRE